MQYLVRIREVLIKDVIVEADDKYEAEEIVEELYEDGKIHVNECEDNSIDCIREASESDLRFHKHVERMEEEDTEEEDDE